MNNATAFTKLDFVDDLIKKNLSEFTEGEIASILNASHRIEEDKKYNPLPNLSSSIIKKVSALAGINPKTDPIVAAELTKNFIVEISETQEIKDMYTKMMKENQEYLKHAAEETDAYLKSHRSLMITRMEKNIEEATDEQKPFLKSILNAYNQSYTLEPMVDILSSAVYKKGMSKSKYEKRYYTDFDYTLQHSFSTQLLTIDQLIKCMESSTRISFSTPEIRRVCMALASYAKMAGKDRDKAWFMYNVAMNIYRVCTTKGTFVDDDELFIANLRAFLREE